ncbi:TetR family transcriptional regulator C-terminal domain-containing protein [Frondihabitans sp. PhB188]|uniref:TetR family transcriptional regulator C-terminal domain-containing protein n=1 Tax=Frondihabitans sp. PhB188 TaxID=2485200 RepID=UPI001315A052|nr:TetR family transcriptional regulator C-terminal domain-containing protein [Frondihabitans sp. PhB188]
MSTTTQLSGGSSDGRSAIDAAARQIAFTSGLSGITLRRLAATAGVSPGDVAQHEPSMSALIARTFEVLATDELQAAAADIDRSIAAGASPLETLTMLVESLLQDTHDDYNSVWADAWSLGRHNAPLAAAARTNMEGWNDTIARVVEAGIAAGQFADVAPDLVAMQFLALIDSTTAYSLVGYRTAAERAELMRRTLEISLALPVGSL